MTGKIVKRKWPKWANRHKIKDEDILFLAGDKIRILVKHNKQNKLI